MWKSVIYKEWLKIKWVAFIFAVAGMLITGYIFLKVMHDSVFNQSLNYWYPILFQGNIFFGYLKYLPVSTGLAIAIAQFFPETVNKRIKLTFHLPIHENKVLMIMVLFGAVCLLSIFLVTLLFFLCLEIIYFPTEIIKATFISITPWFLAGFTTYHLTALIVLEPIWKYRFVYFIACAAFIPVYFQSSAIGAYAPAIPTLIVITAVLSISLVFSGYRFRKGEI